MSSKFALGLHYGLKKVRFSKFYILLNWASDTQWDLDNQSGEQCRIEKSCSVELKLGCDQDRVANF